MRAGTRKPTCHDQCTLSNFRFQSDLVGLQAYNVQSFDYVNLISAKRQKGLMVKDTGCGVRFPEFIS